MPSKGRIVKAIRKTAYRLKTTKYLVVETKVALSVMLKTYKNDRILNP